MKENWIYASVPGEREWERERDFCSWPWARSFLQASAYTFAVKKYGGNSTHHRTMNILVVRNRVCTRKTRSSLQVCRPADWIQIPLYIKEADVVTQDRRPCLGVLKKRLCNFHCAWPQTETEVITKLTSLWRSIWGGHLNTDGDFTTYTMRVEPYAPILKKKK